MRITRATFEAWNSLDVERILALTPLDFEFRLNSGVPGVPDVVRGHEGVRELLEAWYVGPWVDGLESRIERIYDLGEDRVLALVTFCGTGRDSGIEVNARYAQLGTIRDGMVADIEGFPGWGPAKRAAGIDKRS